MKYYFVILLSGCGETFWASGQSQHWRLSCSSWNEAPYFSKTGKGPPLAFPCSELAGVDSWLPPSPLLFLMTTSALWGNWFDFRHDALDAVLSRWYQCVSALPCWMMTISQLMSGEEQTEYWTVQEAAVWVGEICNNVFFCSLVCWVQSSCGLAFYVSSLYMIRLWHC